MIFLIIQRVKTYEYFWKFDHKEEEEARALDCF